MPPLCPDDALPTHLFLNRGKKIIKLMMPRSVLMPEEREGADFEAPGHVR